MVNRTSDLASWLSGSLRFACNSGHDAISKLDMQLQQTLFQVNASVTVLVMHNEKNCYPVYARLAIFS